MHPGRGDQLARRVVRRVGDDRDRPHRAVTLHAARARGPAGAARSGQAVLDLQRRAVASAGSAARASPSTPSNSASSPLSNISVTMSQPPTSSPRTNSCGIVGHCEIAESSWRMRGSGRMSTAAKRASSACSAATVRVENPHAGASGRPLHEEDDLVLLDRLGDRLADRVGLADRSCAPHWLRVVNDRAWMGPPISSPKTS